MTAATLPTVEHRVGFALAHDAQAPLRMLASVLGSLPEDGDGSLLAVASNGLQRIDAVVAGLAEALRADLALDGVCPAEQVEEVAHRAFAGAGGDPAWLAVTTAEIHLPAGTLEQVLADLFAHALADRGDGPRRTTVRVTDDGIIEVVDDGDAPTASPAGAVRPVAESVARALLIAQRVALATGGHVEVDPQAGAVRTAVTLGGREQR